MEADLGRLSAWVERFRMRHDRWPDSLDEALAPDAPGELSPGGVPVWVPIANQGGALVWLGPDGKIGQSCTCNTPTDGVLWVVERQATETTPWRWPYEVFEGIRRPWTPDPEVPLAEGTRRDVVNRALAIAGR
jgi:hypothetical protein